MAGCTMPFATTRRMRWGCSFGSILVALCLAAAPPAHCHDPGGGTRNKPRVEFRFETGANIGPPPQIRIPPPESVAAPPDNSSSSDNLDQWHKNLVRERQVEVRFRSAQKTLDSGHWVA